MPDVRERLQAALGDAYRIERELARGGMSQLFLATELSLNRQVVVKLLPPEMASEVSAARFKQEIEVAAQLQHPHVLPVHAAGSHGDLIYYIMPYVAGESLRQHLQKEGRLSVEEATRILTEVADALAYAHERGVVHRDIKPENILLQQGHAVLTDFGVARAVEQAREGARLTEVGTAVGTPGYMSPEQAAGDALVDARADLYALALVGYEMLAGELPFAGPSPQAVLAARLTEDPAPVRQHRAETPPGLSMALDRALARDPAKRFQTATDFREAVRVATGVMVASRPTKRHWVAGAVGLFAVAIAVYAVWPRPWSAEGDPRQSLIVFPFENKTGTAEIDYLEEASMNLLGLAVSHWDDLRVYDDERTGSLLRRRGVQTPADIDFDAAQAMAKDARVGTLVMGDIRREGDSLAIEAKVHDVATGNRIATEIVRAPVGGDPRVLFDSLAARILMVSGAPPGERPDLLAQTTSSLEAYREYLAGSSALQLFEIDSARAHLQRAVALDSTFALAYIRLRDAEGWAGFESAATRRELVAKAMAHSDDLPLRYRLLVQSHVAYESGRFRAARALVEQAVARDSNDIEAWYQLGEAHFHDRATLVPHADTAGNLGKALVAFRRTLAIDSGYILAYQHIVDALAACGANNPWLCLRDSAVYAAQEELVAAYGRAAVERHRERARADHLEALYAWVGAAPTSQRARMALLATLLDLERYDEARGQIAIMRADGRAALADAWESRIAFLRDDYATAARLMRDAVREPDGYRDLAAAQFQDVMFQAFTGGALVGAAKEAIEQIVGMIPDDTVSGPNEIELPKHLLADFIWLQVAATVGADAQGVGADAARWLDSLEAHYEPGTDAHQTRLANSGSTILAAYVTARDTTLLSRFIAHVDTSRSRTWRTMLAHLALQRGDTATARARLDAHYGNADAIEFNGAPGSVRLFAWADLLRRLGALRPAAEALERFETDDFGEPWPALRVRSWAERGGLYQQLGDSARALRMYEQFVAAWEGGDELVQPLVERARSAIATLRGEARATLPDR